MSSPHRLGLSSCVAALAAALCLVLSPVALAGDPATSIKINEVESDGPADFIELTNTSATATDVSGLVLKDNDDSRTLAVGAGTSIPAGGFLAVDTEVGGGFGMGSNDAARVFLPDGTTQIDGHSWTSHASTTFGRCPDGTGAFVTTGSATKGAANDCPPPLVTQPWPGAAAVSTVDQTGVLGSDVSGLDYEGSGSATPGVLWAVDNGNSTMLRMLWNGAEWVRDTADGWAGGKALRHPDGVGRPDSEGVTLTDAGAAGGVYVSSERELGNNGVSRVSVLRYDVSGADTTLTATREWDLTADLPVVGPNAGAESVEWVPDTYLVGAGFVDQATGNPYDPATYPNHGTGLFFVGLEANGAVYAYALDQTSGSFTRVATFASGFTTFGALHWEPATNQLWVVCDNNCSGRSSVFEVDTQPGATQGRFVRVTSYERPTGMGNLNNEGFTIPPAEECAGGTKPVFWADDGNTDSHVLRAGTIPCSPPAPDGADFNGDGFADLAVGVPGEDRNGVTDAGIVHILYGSASGVGAAGSQVFSQDHAGVRDVAEAGDRFGHAVAAGDVNGDGFTDLAVGVPGESVGLRAEAGIVQILFGSSSGLTGMGSQSISQQTVGVADAAEPGDRFGASLAAGQLGGTAESDLVIGVPREDFLATDAGAVHVLLGGASGMTATGSRFWTQSTGAVVDTAEADDRFGEALAVGDLGGTSAPELAIGAPGETMSGVAGAGLVHVLAGSGSGPTDAGNDRLFQDRGGIPDTAEAGDGFGAALVVGDFDGDSVGDLAIGTPDEDLGAATDAGVVLVLRGAAGGVTVAGSTEWTQATAGIAGGPQAGDRFGAALAAADLGSTPHADLAVGVPGDVAGAVSSAGTAHVLLGSGAGLTAAGSQQWHQDRSGVADTAESGDLFGATLTAGTYRGGLRAGLVMGAPGEKLGMDTGAGALNVLYGGAAGLVAGGSATLSQDTIGITDTSEVGDAFAAGLG